MRAQIIKGMMHIKLPVITPAKKSKSGKTLLVASSRGNRRTAAKVEGMSVIANVKAFVRPQKREKTCDGRAKLKPKAQSS